MGIFRGGGENQNVIVGIILLIVLAFFAGPGTLSRFLAPLSPYFEGVPCANLRRADDRANHQSLLGRASEFPIEVRVSASSVPTDAAGFLYVTITVINNSIGSVPIVYSPTQVLVGDNGTSGMGIVFSPQFSLGTRSGTGANVPEDQIRILGPRQRCLHTIEIPGGNILTNPAFTGGQASVVAYYRGNERGAIAGVPEGAPTPIYPDQGLPTGVATSEPVRISVAGQ
jgi:hypothetical protein